MTELKTATDISMQVSKKVGWYDLSPSKKFTINEITPAATRPSAITKSDITVISPGLENPESNGNGDGKIVLQIPSEEELVISKKRRKRKNIVFEKRIQIL